MLTLLLLFLWGHPSIDSKNEVETPHNRPHQIQLIDTTNWHELLPDCPCTNPDFKGLTRNDGWAKDKGNLAKHHPGAVECFRSYPQTQTTAGYSGQQCCYDAEGKLIKTGPGAGTPDKVSPCYQENKKGNMKYRLKDVRKHYLLDVKPWNKMLKESPDSAWVIYHKGWPPNPGQNCD
ncbi:MAG: hypothetical protein MRZ79_07045 [Bacteroidia bacterium]|nr:hypothetical protein [Bacteroidia bacterium]